MARLLLSTTWCQKPKEIKMKYYKFFIISIALLLLAATSYAAPFNQTFRNDYEADGIYLFITEGNADFTRWMRLPGGWDTGVDEDKTLSAFGPVINPGQLFRVRFSNRGTFTLEWAELLNGAVQGSGSLFAVNGRFVGSNSDFTSSIPTPITGTVWLLGAGLIGLVFIRRKLPFSRS